MTQMYLKSMYGCVYNKRPFRCHPDVKNNIDKINKYN